VRLSPTAFTRNRTLTLPRMAALMISGMKMPQAAANKKTNRSQQKERAHPPLKRP
jgi:hypothetical protein